MKKIGTLAEVDLVFWVVHVLMRVCVFGIEDFWYMFIHLRFGILMAIPFLAVIPFGFLEIILAVVSTVYTVKKIRRKEFDLSFYIVLGYTAFVFIACVVGLPELMRE